MEKSIIFPMNFCISQRKIDFSDTLGNRKSAGRSDALDSNNSRFRTRNDNATKVQRLMIAKPVKGWWVVLMTAVTKKPRAKDQTGRNSNTIRARLRMALFAMRYARFSAGELRTAFFTLRRRDFSKLGECSFSLFLHEAAETFLPAHCLCPGARLRNRSIVSKARISPL